MVGCGEASDFINFGVLPEVPEARVDKWGVRVLAILKSYNLYKFWSIYGKAVFRGPGMAGLGPRYGRSTCRLRR